MISNTVTQSAYHNDSLLAALVIVVHEPLDRLLDGLGHGGELEVGQVLTQLLVRGGLLVLTVSLGAVPHNLALELLRERARSIKQVNEPSRQTNHQDKRKCKNAYGKRVDSIDG